MKSVNVLSFFRIVPLNAITVTVTGNGTPVVGQLYGISCTVLYPDGITSPIMVEWYGPEGRLVNGSGITIGSVLASQGNTTSNLEFSPFRVVHGGRFSCRATTISLAPPFNISKSADINIVVTSKFKCVFLAVKERGDLF